VRVDGIEDCQVRQIVEAVRRLLMTAKAKVVGEVERGSWLDSARTLALDHPTIARETAARKVGGRTKSRSSGSDSRRSETRRPPWMTSVGRTLG
jgi:hypothetical protein